MATPVKRLRLIVLAGVGFAAVTASGAVVHTAPGASGRPTQQQQRQQQEQQRRKDGQQTLILEFGKEAAKAAAHAAQRAPHDRPTIPRSATPTSGSRSARPAGGAANAPADPLPPSLRTPITSAQPSRPLSGSVAGAGDDAAHGLRFTSPGLGLSDDATHLGGSLGLADNAARGVGSGALGLADDAARVGTGALGLADDAARGVARLVGVGAAGAAGAAGILLKKKR